MLKLLNKIATYLAPAEGFEAIKQNGLLYRGLAASLVGIVSIVIQGHEIFSFPASIEVAYVQDFWTFYAAAVSAVAREGAMLYDPERFRALFEDAHGLLWLYPPNMLVLLLPFGVMSYGTAKAIWVFGSIGLALGAAYFFSGKNKLIGLAALTSPAVFSILFTGQLSVFFAALLAVGFYFAKTRPILAGICLGLLTIKPQFGLLVPLFLLVCGAWRAIAVATVTAIILGLFSVLAFGIESWAAFFASLTSTHSGFMEYTETNGRITVSDIVRGFIAPNAPVQIITLSVLCVAAFILYRARGMQERWSSFVALALLLTFLSAPYIWVYDCIVVLFAIALFLSEKPSLPRLGQMCILLAWFAPLAPYAHAQHYSIPIIWFTTASVVYFVLSDWRAFSLKRLFPPDLKKAPQI